MFTLLMPHPAAMTKTDAKKTLIIADPHLGWEIALQEKGIHVPSQMPRLLEKLLALLTEFKPDALLILGDVKYTVTASEPGEWHDIPDFFDELCGKVKEIGIIRGNHDANLEPMLPQGVVMHPATGVVEGDVGMFHGHKWPSPALLQCKTLFMGHLHPVVVFRDPAGIKLTRQIWMKANCVTEALAKVLLQKHGVKLEGTAADTVKKHYGFKPRTTQLFIMPSFNDFLGGRPVNESHPKKELGAEALVGPVLRSEAVDVENSETYLLDGTYLGTLHQLKRL
jgi:putative SbcD/Mre11-related phosphoesterase